jgi:hypothetical protein
MVSLKLGGNRSGKLKVPQGDTAHSPNSFDTPNPATAGLEIAI